MDMTIIERVAAEVISCQYCGPPHWGWSVRMWASACGPVGTVWGPDGSTPKAAPHSSRETAFHKHTQENSQLVLRGLSCNIFWHVKLSLISSKCFFSSQRVGVPLSHHWQARAFSKADNDECEISGRWYSIVPNILSNSITICGRSNT